MASVRFIVWKFSLILSASRMPSIFSMTCAGSTWPSLVPDSASTPLKYWPMFCLSHLTNLLQSELLPPPISIICPPWMLFGVAFSRSFSVLTSISCTTISGSPSALFNGRYANSIAYFFSSLVPSLP